MSLGTTGSKKKLFDKISFKKPILGLPSCHWFQVFFVRTWLACKDHAPSGLKPAVQSLHFSVTVEKMKVKGRVETAAYLHGCIRNPDLSIFYFDTSSPQVPKLASNLRSFCLLPIVRVIAIITLPRDEVLRLYSVSGFFTSDHSSLRTELVHSLTSSTHLQSNEESCLDHSLTLELAMGNMER